MSALPRHNINAAAQGLPSWLPCAVKQVPDCPPCNSNPLDSTDAPKQAP